MKMCVIYLAILPKKFLTAFLQAAFQFKDTAEVYQYLMSLSEGDFIAYQQRIAHFLQSEQARPFGSDFFAETIVNTIVEDLKKDA